MKKGFTLIETVVGLVIIGIAFYVLISVFIAIAPRTARVETLNKKAYLAQEKIEEYLTRPFTAVSSVAASSFAGNFSSYNYQIVVTYVATSDLNSAVGYATPFKNVRVRVWGGPVDAAETVEVVTLVTTYEAL